MEAVTKMAGLSASHVPNSCLTADKLLEPLQEQLLDLPDVARFLLLQLIQELLDLGIARILSVELVLLHGRDAFELVGHYCHEIIGNVRDTADLIGVLFRLFHVVIPFRRTGGTNSRLPGSHPSCQRGVEVSTVLGLPFTENPVRWHA